MIDLKKVLFCAVAGLLSAILADLDAWSSGRDPEGNWPGCDWRKLVRRYTKGITSGVITGLGWSQL